jgi:hypothetical protein
MAAVPEDVTGSALRDGSRLYAAERRSGGAAERRSGGVAAWRDVPARRPS